MGKRVFGIQSADEEMDRFRAYLEMLLEGGLDEFDSMVDHVIQDSGCSAGSVAIRRVGSRYDFGHDKCSRHSDCRIRAMLERKADTVAVLAAALSEIPEGSRTAEIQLSLQFLAKVTADTSCSKDCDPCLKVGDVLIAIESFGVPAFFTKNYKESRHLAPPLKQTLIVRPNSEEQDDIVCPAGEPITAFK